MTTDAAEWRVELKGAAMAGDAEGLRALLADVPEGESVDSDLGDGETALIVASGQANLAACEALLQFGANPDLRSAHGVNARLFSFNRAGKPRELLEAGARLFAAYCGVEPAAIPTRQQLEVCYEGQYAATEMVRKGFLVSAGSHVRQRLGCLPYWRPGGTSGVIWVTETEVAALEAAFREAEALFTGFTVRLTRRELYLGDGRVEAVEVLEGVEA